MEEENNFIVFFKKHWSKIFLGVLAIACIAAWSERLFTSNRNHKKQDFVQAYQIFERFQKETGISEESIATAESILTRHPELHPKYDALLAMHFFAQANKVKGAQYAQSAIAQADAQLPPFYKDYAFATLLIAEQKYAEAFQSALTLQNKLNDQPGFSHLEAMNTLRLLFLADTLGDLTQKKLFWNKLQNHPAYSEILPLFHEGNISLADYIRWHSLRL